MNAVLAHGQEAFAVVAGLIYVVLILRRNRWGWVAGALSSSVYVLISARARLPMQSLLQAYYVIMAVYGWFSWTRNAQEEGGRIYRWSLRRHLWVALLLLSASAASAQF
ncbi:MAG TPA: nicotinamide mononucleotide transporter family protein, partial [Steroidobacteraceae bacterium]|nr:nicotinamide mononucleotide transporter family protein [Steroidobacteraceae bacterium]